MGINSSICQTSTDGVAEKPVHSEPIGAESALSQLLGSTAVDTFFDNYYGQRGIHIQGSMLKRRLFGWEQLNSLLNNHKELPEGAKILVDGKENVPKDYLVLLRDLRRGLTVFFEDIDRHDPILASFLSKLSRELQSTTRFNMYLSSPGRQGRKMHFDTHDVFVIQIEGSKRWTIYEINDPTPIFTRKNHDVEAPDESNPYLDCTLRKGDVLYLPRGHWHNVSPLEDVSLHLTLGVFIPNGIEFLLWLVDECTELEAARENIPLRLAFRSDEDYLQARKEYSKRILSVFAERAGSESLCDDYESFCVASLPNRAPFNFPFSIAREEFMPAGETLLKAIDNGAKISLAADSNSASVVYSNRVITIPLALLELVREMLSGIPFTIDMVERRLTPDSNPQTRGLVRTFIAEGLIRPVV